MSPEELEATREGANVDYAPDIAYEDWQAMAKALLAHIDDHEAYIASLKGELEIAGQRLREMSLKKDEFALMQALETRKEQIEAMKEKLVEEVAWSHFNEERLGARQDVSFSDVAEEHRRKARQQLKAEMPTIFDGVE